MPTCQVLPPRRRGRRRWRRKTCFAAHFQPRPRAPHPPWPRAARHPWLRGRFPPCSTRPHGSAADVGGPHLAQRADVSALDVQSEEGHPAGHAPSNPFLSSMHMDACMRGVCPGPCIVGACMHRCGGQNQNLWEISHFCGCRPAGAAAGKGAQAAAQQRQRSSTLSGITAHQPQQHAQHCSCWPGAGASRGNRLTRAQRLPMLRRGRQLQGHCHCCVLTSHSKGKAACEVKEAPAGCSMEHCRGHMEPS